MVIIANTWLMGFANEKEPIVYYGYAIIIICYNFMPQLNTKTMVQFSYSRLYLGIKTISCRLLQGIGRMGMDWDLKKSCIGQRFQVLMPRLQKSPKTILWLVQAWIPDVPFESHTPGRKFMQKKRFSAS